MSKPLRHNQKNKSGTHNHNTATKNCEASGNMHVCGEVEIDFHPQVKEADSANKKKNESREAKRVLMEGIGLILLFITALGTIWQARSNQKQLNIARRNGEAQQRAWVLLDNYSMSNDLSTSQPTQFFVSYKNTGQSPALQVHADPRISLEGGSCHGTGNHIPYVGSTIMSPGQSLGSANLIMSALTQACLNDLQNGTASLKIHEAISYKDIFGYDHSALFCIRYDGLYAHTLVACDEQDSTN